MRLVLNIQVKHNNKNSYHECLSIVMNDVKFPLQHSWTSQDSFKLVHGIDLCGRGVSKTPGDFQYVYCPSAVPSGQHQLLACRSNHTDIYQASSGVSKILRNYQIPKESQWKMPACKCFNPELSARTSNDQGDKSSQTCIVNISLQKAKRYVHVNNVVYIYNVQTKLSYQHKCRTVRKELTGEWPGTDGSDGKWRDILSQCWNMRP